MNELNVIYRRRRGTTTSSAPNKRRKLTAEVSDDETPQKWEWNGVFMNTKTNKSCSKAPTYTLATGTGMIVKFENIFKCGVRVGGQKKHIQQRNATSWLTIINNKLSYAEIRKILDKRDIICDPHTIENWGRWHEVKNNKYFWKFWEKLITDLKSTLSIWINENKFECLQNQQNNKPPANVKKYDSIEAVSLDETVQNEIVLWATKKEVSESNVIMAEAII